MWLALAILLSPPVCSLAEGATKYKKSTVVDFEGSMVEGKSRKPYSTYLTQQKDSAFNDLYSWKPDIERSLQQSKTRMDKKL